jgi:DNA polymerase family B, exonuclease domain
VCTKIHSHTLLEHTNRTPAHCRSQSQSLTTMPRLYLLHCCYEFDSTATTQDPHDPQVPQDTKRKRIIQLVCKTQSGANTVLKVKDWLPWLYIKPTARKLSEFIKTGAAMQWRAELRKSLRRAGCVKVDLVERTQFVGFTNMQQQQYAMCRFEQWPVNYITRFIQGTVLEASVKVTLKFFHETGLRSGAWFDAPDSEDFAYSELIPVLGDNTPPRLTVMAYDLETTGLDPAKCTIKQDVLGVLGHRAQCSQQRSAQHSDLYPAYRGCQQHSSNSSYI